MGWLRRLFGKKPPRVSEPRSRTVDSSDEGLCKGVVDPEMFEGFREAHSYDSASSFNYLNTRLATLLETVRRGVTLQLHGPDGTTTAASESEFRAWAKKHFPHAKFL